MADVEPVIEDPLGDVRRLIDLAELLAEGIPDVCGDKHCACHDEEAPKIKAEVRKVAERLKGRL